MTGEKPLSLKDAMADLIKKGVVFRVFKDKLLWFAPQRAMTVEIALKLAAHKKTIIKMLLAGHPASSRTWGHPSGADWLEHPALKKP